MINLGFLLMLGRLLLLAGAVVAWWSLLAFNATIQPIKVPTHTLSLQETSDKVVDTVITIVGKWGDYIHGKSYQQEALVTYKGWQYATYYNANRKLCVARRELPSGTWWNIVFLDYTYLGDDNHNVPVIEISPKDGTIHLAFDHHGDLLHYRVSATNAANDPSGITWEASLFGPVVDHVAPVIVPVFP